MSSIKFLWDNAGLHNIISFWHYLYQYFVSFIISELFYSPKYSWMSDSFYQTIFITCLVVLFMKIRWIEIWTGQADANSFGAHTYIVYILEHKSTIYHFKLSYLTFFKKFFSFCTFSFLGKLFWFCN